MNLLLFKFLYEEAHFICLVLDTAQWLQEYFFKYVGFF